MASTTQEITLPSRGLLYKEGPGEKPIPEGKVVICKLLIDELALFDGDADPHTRMREVIRAAAKLPQGFSSDKLLAGDGFALMVALRNLSVPVKYPITFRCESCKTLNKHKFNPQELVVKMAKTTGDDATVEPFTINLPDFELPIQMRFARLEDQEATVKYARQIKAKTGDIRDVSTKHGFARCLVAVDGKVAGDILNREQIVQTFSFFDGITLEKAIEEREPGIDTLLHLPCSSCGYVNEQEMPFTQEFFRPTHL